MTAVFSTPARRVVLAIALSVLIHVAILWLPYIQLPHAAVPLPPLSVRLMPPSQPVDILAKPEQTGPRNQRVPNEVEASAMAKPEDRALTEMNRASLGDSARPLPRHLQLKYTVYEGEQGSRIGEILQQMDIHDGRYTLRSVRRTSGLASLRNTDQFLQTSLGKIDEHGLRPDFFEEERVSRNGNRKRQARFDWAAQKLRYSGGGESELPANTQDALSFLYQLPHIPLNAEFLSLPVSDGTQLQQFQIEIGTKTDIAAPLGKLRTLQMRKMHRQGEPYFEIWLGLEYRLLPVKFSMFDGSGNVTEEYVVSDIRAADD